MVLARAEKPPIYLWAGITKAPPGQLETGADKEKEIRTGNSNSKNN
jgi:hypothetical protein